MAQHVKLLQGRIRAENAPLYGTLVTARNSIRTKKTTADGQPVNDFGAEWVAAWMKSDNFRLFNKFTGIRNWPIVVATKLI